MEREILHKVVLEIDTLHNITCSIEKVEPISNDKIYDAIIKIKIASQEVWLKAEIKSKIVPAQIPKLLSLRSKVDDLIVIANYITPKAKEILKENQISYADTAGNMFINKGLIYIYVDGNAPQFKELESKSRAFTPAGLKVVFQFITNPEYLNHPYRFIAERATVTIRTVGKTIEGLLNENLIVKVNKNEYQYLDREKLFQRWVTEYNYSLKAKLEKRTFRWLNKNQDWSKMKLPVGTCWGGAAAAGLMTNHLIADNWKIYTELEFTDLMRELKLIPDKNGEVEIIETFWKEPKNKISHLCKNNIIHPILVYADLMDSTNARYLETAKKIYEDYVESKL